MSKREDKIKLKEEILKMYRKKNKDLEDKILDLELQKKPYREEIMKNLREIDEIEKGIYWCLGR